MKVQVGVEESILNKLLGIEENLQVHIEKNHVCQLHFLIEGGKAMIEIYFP